MIIVVVDKNTTMTTNTVYELDMCIYLKLKPDWDAYIVVYKDAVVCLITFALRFTQLP